MPGFFPGRPGGEHDEPLLDMILERRPIPPGAPPEIHGLARMLAAAAGPAEPGDLPGQAAALAAFTRLASPPGTSPAALRSARCLPSKRPARGRLPLVVALAVAAAGLGSTAAAYADVLPSPVQHFAHVAFGAPAPPHDAFPGTLTVTSSPVPSHSGSSASGSANGQPTAPDPASDKTSPGQSWYHGRTANGVGPAQTSCHAAQGQGQNQGQGRNQNQGQGQGQNQGQGQGQNQGHSQYTPSPNGRSNLSSPTAVCPDGTVPSN